MLSNQNDDLFGQTTAAPASGNGAASVDDIFGSAPAPAPAQSDDIFGQPVPQQNNSVDIFGQPQQAASDDIYAQGPAQVEPEAVSALVEWQKEKDEEIAKNDQDEQEAATKMKAKASEELAAYNAKIEEAQTNRAAHNKSVDEETMAALNGESDNKWERVVSYIDFNRNELHEKDVSRMKSLLLQLKH